MVEVGGSNPPGPTKFLSRCFSSKLFFLFAESSRVLASYLYPGKVALKSQHCLAVEVPGKPPYPRKRIAQKREVSKRSSIGMRHTATGTR